MVHRKNKIKKKSCSINLFQRLEFFDLNLFLKIIKILYYRYFKMAKKYITFYIFSHLFQITKFIGLPNCKHFPQCRLTCLGFERTDYFVVYD